MALTQEELAARIKALTPADRLRLAAEILEAGSLNLAETIAGMVLRELAATRLLVKR